MARKHHQGTRPWGGTEYVPHFVKPWRALAASLVRSGLGTRINEQNAIDKHGRRIKVLAGSEPDVTFCESHWCRFLCEHLRIPHQLVIEESHKVADHNRLRRMIPAMNYIPKFANGFDIYKIASHA